MKVIAEPTGFTLKFDDLEDIEVHMKNLQRMIEWLEEVIPQGYKPEFTYRVYESSIKDEMKFSALESLLASSLKDAEQKPKIVFTAEEVDKSMRVICEVQPLIDRANIYEREARKLRLEAEALEKEIWE